MNDSMDEEFERAGGAVGLAARPAGATQHPQASPSNPVAAPPFSLQAPIAAWARKRGREAIGMHGHVGAANFTTQEGVHSLHNGAAPVGHTRGRESPDSDMSSGSGSSSSDFSINRGIKRMRIDEQKQQHLQQPISSAFGPYSSPANSAGGRRPSSQGWISGAGRTAGIGIERHGGGHRRQDGRLLGGDDGLGLGRLPFAINNSAGSIIPDHEHSRHTGGSDILTPISDTAATRVPPPVADIHSPLQSLDRSLSGGRVFRPSDPALVSRSNSLGMLNNLQQPGDAGREGGEARAAGAGGPPPFPVRSASSDASAVVVPTFSPFTPQPPAQARYVRGIRVEANAPADVDYSNVNHALRQLHMERRLAAERVASAGREQAVSVGVGRPQTGAMRGGAAVGGHAGWPGLGQL